MSQPSELLDRAQKILKSNDMGIFTKPAPHQYPHQWNWDAAVIALGYSYFDLSRAMVEIRSLLRGQWKDGMVPHIVYHTGPSNYFPDPGFWQTRRSPDAPDIPTSGITQPPLVATVLRTIHSRITITEYLGEFYPAVLPWHRWLHQQRDADGSGLACLLHPWESGTDDSPRWLEAIANITPKDLPAYQRLDTIHVPGSQRPHQADYDRFIYLVDIFRRNRYNPADLLRDSPFLVQDVFYNSILHRADLDLRFIAAELGKPTDEIDGWITRTSSIFTQRFWDDNAGLYYDYNVRTGSPIRVNTAAVFMPLYAGLANKEQAQRLISEHWRNSAEYAPTADQPYSITSTSRSETAWESRRYWRGPVWIILNWLLADGVSQYGYTDLAEVLRLDSLNLINRAGFWEYFDPVDGTGCGSPDFSWTAALAFELSKQ